MSLPDTAKPTTFDLYRPFGSASPTSTGHRGRLTEQIDEGRPPGAIRNAPSTHTTAQTSAPAANTVMADSGAVIAGLYEVSVHVGSDDAAIIGRYLLVEHRNAGNTATLHRWLVPVPDSKALYWPMVALAANERIRVVSGSAAAAAGTVYTSDVYLRPASDLFWTHYLDCEPSIDLRDGLTRVTGADAMTFADGDEVRIPDASGDRYVVVLVVMMGFGTERKFKRAYLLRHLANWLGSGQV